MVRVGWIWATTTDGGKSKEFGETENGGDRFTPGENRSGEGDRFESGSHLV